MEFSEEHFLENRQWLELLEEETPLFIDYLERTYHASLWQEIPVVIKQLEAIRTDSTLSFPHLEEVQLHFKLVAITLLRHMLSEEATLFVSLKKMEWERKINSPEEKQKLKKLVVLFENEQGIVKEGYAKIRTLCRNYEVPIHDGVLPELYTRLKSCENLMMKQIFLERNILFRKIIQSTGKKAEKD